MKPGWQTTEFWLHAVSMLIGAIAASGILSQSWIVQVLGIVQAMLSASGYGFNRTTIKTAISEVKASEDASLRTHIQ